MDHTAKLGMDTRIGPGPGPTYYNLDWIRPGFVQPERDTYMTLFSFQEGHNGPKQKFKRL